MGRNPTSVLRGVIAVYVDTVEFIPRRLFASISEKVLKGFPAGADANTSAPIVLVALVPGVVASGSHVQPSSIRGSWLHAVTVFKRMLFTSTASAACRMTTGQMLGCCDGLASALAFTQPSGIAVSRKIWSPFSNSKEAKFLACQIS